MRTFAIGDIHGYCSALEALLTVVPIAEGDRVVFLGDYVNKGPDSRGTIECILQFRKQCKAVFLRGNHDQLVLDARNNPDALRKLIALGGKRWLRSYGRGSLGKILEEMPKRHWKFLEKRCRNYFETKEIMFVHGGIRPDRKPEEEDPKILQSLRIDSAAPHQSGKTVICGHTAQGDGEIVDFGHTICIDTGIAKGKYLTCLATDTFEFWQASESGELWTGKLRKGGK